MFHEKVQSNRLERKRSLHHPLTLERLEPRQLLAADIVFSDAEVYATGRRPTGLDVADFNGDERLDLVVANADSDSVSFLRGTGDGSFQRLWQDVTVRTNPRAVAAGDLDKDGHVDVVTADEANRVSVLYGMGNGEFRRPQNIRLNGVHESIALADMNGDDRLDILVTTNGTLGLDDVTNLEPGVQLILANDDPLATDAFLMPRRISTSTTPVKVIVSDMDGDGHMDVAVANSAFFTIGDDNVTLLKGHGDGTFDIVKELKSGGNPQSIASGDLNGDGQKDLIVVNQDTIGIMTNLGAGSFAPEVTHVVGNNPSSVAVADLDLDGDADLAIANHESVWMTILANRGDGTFFPSGRFATGAGATSIIAADANRDGLPELTMARVDTGDVVVLPNESTDLPNAVRLDGAGDLYVQSFDTALAASDGPGARLPSGWSATLNGEQFRHVSESFPPSSPNGLFNAGFEQHDDRALATGVFSDGQSAEFTWSADLAGADAAAIQVAFDIEAWSAFPGLATVPGEAAFNVILEADSGQGFETIHDFGKLTTRQVFRTPVAPAGEELWKTDGMAVSFVADIKAGEASSSPRWFTIFNEELYFVANETTIYRFDGLEMSEVADLSQCVRLTQCDAPDQSWVFNDALYFNVGGSARCCSQVTDHMFLKIDSSGLTWIPNDFEFMHLYGNYGEPIVFNDELYFTNAEEEVIIGRELWKLADNEVSLIADINPTFDRFNHPNSSSSPGEFTVFQGELYFTAGPEDENDREMWKTDGSSVTQIAEIIDLTQGNTWCGSCVDYLGVVDGKLIFSATDNLESALTDGLDRSLWTFDGTQVEKIYSGFLCYCGASPRALRDPTVLRDELFFIASDLEHGQELWKTDGRTTTRITDINPGPADSVMDPFPWDPIVFNDELYFVASNEESGRQGIWKTDGTNILELTEPPGGYATRDQGFSYLFWNATVFNDELYFVADTLQFGRELWKGQGTNVERVTDIHAGPLDSIGFAELIEFNGELYFSATNGDGGASVIDGNSPSSRFEFDSGPISAHIPEGSAIRMRFSTHDAGANLGYVYGLDNFEFRVVAAGDANGDGEFNQLDIIAVLQTDKYLTGEPATFAEGDFTGDGVFDQNDVVAALQTGYYLQGPYAAIQSDDAATPTSKRPQAKVADIAFLDYV